MTEHSDMPKVGMWRAVLRLGDYRAKQLLWPEGLPALVIGAGGTAFVVPVSTLAERMSAVGNVLVLTGALLAVVFAALAIVVSLPASGYLRALAETEGGGFQRFLDPFLIAVGTQIAILLLTLAYGLTAGHIPAWIEQLAFCAIGFLFVYGLLDIGALARSLVRHGILRSVEALEGESPKAGEVHHLPNRRDSGTT